MLTAIKLSHMMAALSFPLGGIGQEDLCWEFCTLTVLTRAMFRFRRQALLL